MQHHLLATLQHGVRGDCVVVDRSISSWEKHPTACYHQQYLWPTKLQLLEISLFFWRCYSCAAIIYYPYLVQEKIGLLCSSSVFYWNFPILVSSAAADCTDVNFIRSWGCKSWTQAQLRSLYRMVHLKKKMFLKTTSNWSCRSHNKPSNNIQLKLWNLW